jgi:DNA-directed RNA polymerase alpha subunit
MSNIGIDEKEFEILKVVLAAHPTWPADSVHAFVAKVLEPYRPKPPADEKLAWPIEVLDRSPYFTMRLRNVLLAEGAYTLGDVLRMREIEWLKTPNMGKKSLNDLKQCLSLFALQLRT